MENVDKTMKTLVNEAFTPFGGGGLNVEANRTQTAAKSETFKHNDRNKTLMDVRINRGVLMKKAIQTATIFAFMMFTPTVAMAAGASSDPAELLVPTLDRVKLEQTTYVNGSHANYTLSEITDDVSAPDGSVTVKIGDKSYYYTPNVGDDTTILKLLSATGSIALKETTSSDALYTTPDGKYYTYDTTKLPQSSYSLSETTVSDPDNLPVNTIVKYEVKEVTKYYDPTTGLEVAEGDKQEGVNYKEVVTKETIPHYYTVTLNKTEYGDSSGDETLTYGWEENADGNLEFKLNPATPVGQQISYKYSELSFNEIKTETKDLIITNPSGIYDSPTHIMDGAALNNPLGITVSLDGILYKNNVNTQSEVLYLVLH